MELKLVVTDEERQQRHVAMLEAVAHEYIKAFNLVQAKTAGYGAAWREQGYMGNLARILSKGSRLKSLLWQDFQYDGTADESVEDTALDLMNLCVFFLLNRGQMNKWGPRG